MIVLDTNVVLYGLQGRIIEPIPFKGALVSVITEIELLGFPGITADERQRIQHFLSACTMIGLTPEIKDEAIALRCGHRLRVADAIIVATARVSKAVLWTNDAQLRGFDLVESHSVDLVDI